MLADRGADGFVTDFRHREHGPADGLRAVAEGRQPLPYPDGWFAVGFSRELKPGDVRVVRFMGGDLVVYRTHAGVAHAVTPYRPHPGARFAHGGKVDGERLVGPFHRLSLAPEGVCVGTGTGQASPRPTLETWRVQERSAMVLVWRDHAGRAPAWEMPETDLSGFSPPKSSCYELAGYAHDIGENSADASHFAWLHGFTDVSMSYETERYRMAFNLSGCWHGVRIEMRLTTHGLGHVLGESNVPSLGIRTKTLAFATPTAPLAWTFRWADVMRVGRLDRLPRPLRMVLYTVLISLAHRWFVTVVRDDFPVWAHRRYVAHPRLMSGEASVAAFRRWMMQFYPASE
ncbi:Rieske 2Fe-2S domain-containing protein [Burkholderia sp. BCC1977]|uniref:Rieske 2Fe-2S domain-containing protein n=1 Tax=Burkholderia sp. BCC1977 TaxID=2817440 RepID=UPI002ABDC2A0|nr:Rieske 2Fe-2S domain-containing protein [Burkholderia sp. BCC1977]